MSRTAKILVALVGVAYVLYVLTIRDGDPLWILGAVVATVLAPILVLLIWIGDVLVRTTRFSDRDAAPDLGGRGSGDFP